MDKKAFLCYVNAKGYVFENDDFNFDHKYLFHLEVDKSQFVYSYKLHISKRKNIIQPEGFWGENISTVNVITGKNGAGKTSFLKFIINHIGIGTTAINGEVVVYIVNQGGTYIVFHNCHDLMLVKSDDASEANIILEKEYSEQMIRDGNYNSPFDNRRFWRNMIFFSNYFGSLGLSRDNEYIINVCKDNEINKIIDRMESLSELSTTTIQVAYQNYRNIKILTYALDEKFQEIASKSKVSVADLVQFKLLHDMNDYGELYQEEKYRFPNGKWIGKNRYHLYISENILVKENDFEFEAAVNKFSVDLMWDFLHNNMISESCFKAFIDELAETENKTGVTIAKEKILNNYGCELGKWIKILKLLEDDSKKFVINWQSSDEFYIKWDKKDLELVKLLITSNSNYSFFSCALVGSETNGYYSSGEESKVNLLISLYAALERMEKGKKEVYNNNIILILDELDAYFHPDYQICLINEMLDLVSKVFEDYYVQIILTSNTPLELSDFPVSNIIYLGDGAVYEGQKEIETFGSNIGSLLKNRFYIHSFMGTFAKRKIDEVIGFLTNQESSNISKEEVMYIISVIGEPIIKDKLQKMYYCKFPEEIPNQFEEIAFYKSQIQNLQRHIMDSNRIDSKILNQLEEELLNLTNMIKEIKG